MLRAANSIADSKHADQPAAKSCSGLVPVPGLPGRDSLTSRRPSELRDMPARPPVVWAFAVYSTFSSRFIILLRHKRRWKAGWFWLLRAQQGHRFRLRANTTVSRRRTVAIEFGTCRSGRIGSAAGSVTFGKARRFEPPGATWA